MKWREVLGKVGSLIKGEWKRLESQTQKMILGAAMAILGFSLPWNVLGEAGSYIQFGLIIGGILAAFMGSKKPGEPSFLSKLGLDGLLGKKKDKTKGSDGYCSKCGRRLKQKEDFCSSCGRERRELN